MTLAPSARLQVPDRPQPFVLPNVLSPAAGVDEALAAEILVVRSPAAVGKSTLAQYLAAAAGQPLLDLSKTRVSTRALSGLLNDEVRTPTPSIAAFHGAEFALIIDALDEGIVVSTAPSFEDFLQTSWELLKTDRSVTDRPKLILLGRDEAVELVELSLEAWGEDLRVSWLELDFFDRDSAANVIRVHAEAARGAPHAQWDSVIGAYFTAIAKALRVEEDELWVDPHGRAFAGYAPVLAAIGQVLGKETVPLRLKNALERTGTRRAWEVIEDVAHDILERERTKITNPLADTITAERVPQNAYDATEQLTLLTHLAHGRPPDILGSGRLSFSSVSDSQQYVRMVRAQFNEHPFLRRGELVSEVLGAIVLSHAIVNDTVRRDNASLLQHASRQPFLWRSSQRAAEVAGVARIEGKYVGYVLNSLWNDSFIRDAHVTIRTLAHDPLSAALKVRTKELTENWVVEVPLPITFYERIRECDCVVDGEVVWKGHEGNRAIAVFEMQGNVYFVAKELKVAASTVRIDKDVRLWAEAIEQTGLREVSCGHSCKVGLGGAFRQWPWNEIDAVLEAPASLRARTRLEALIDQCHRSFSVAPIYVYAGNKLPRQGDANFIWVNRDYSEQEFGQLIEIILEYGLATTRRAPTSDPEPMVIVTFKDSWNRLPAALAASYEGEEVDGELQPVVNELRAAFD